MNFKTLQREIIFSGRIFNLEHVQMQLPNGTVHSYDLVNHKAAVTIVPIDAAGDILFVRQYRVGADQELLELPAGVLNEGEDPAETAAREVREEIGMAAGNMRALGSFFMSPGYSSEYMHIYLATELYPAPLEQDDDEFLQLEAIPAAKVLQMARSGEIHDGKTLAALLMAEAYLPIQG